MFWWCGAGGDGIWICGAIREAEGVDWGEVRAVLAFVLAWVAAGVSRWVWGWRGRRAGGDEASVSCARCGYDVRGNAGVCPECGSRLEGKGTVVGVHVRRWWAVGGGIGGGGGDGVGAGQRRNVGGAGGGRRALPSAKTGVVAGGASAVGWWDAKREGYGGAEPPLGKRLSWRRGHLELGPLVDALKREQSSFGTERWVRPHRSFGARHRIQRRDGGLGRNVAGRRAKARGVTRRVARRLVSDRAELGIGCRHDDGVDGQAPRGGHGRRFRTGFMALGDEQWILAALGYPARPRSTPPDGRAGR